VPRPAEEVAAQLVAEQFPDARAAWLGVSVVTGKATESSDLDIVVLTWSDPVHRRSLLHLGWPVELFIHTETSLEEYLAADVARRQPSLPRMVGESVILLDSDGSAVEWQVKARMMIASGPPRMTRDEIDAARYAITDLIDDLNGRASGVEAAGIATQLWQQTLTLSVTGAGRWTGTGKGLIQAVDPDLAQRSVVALRTALDGSFVALIELADHVLTNYGGRLWAGYRAGDV
jgi:hypothetical protein